MTDVAALQAQLEALKAARSSPALKTRFADREVTFKDDKQLVSAIADLERQIAAAQGTPRSTTVTIRSVKGW
jgi:hypothetical protein